MPNRRTDAASELPLETARERDLYQYYQPLYPPHAAPDSVPRSSYDATLSAFAQLVTLRLNTRRALISLVDRTNQYILAEATRTLSLQSDSVHNDQDELWFGCTTLPRSQGLCESALDILPLSTTRKLSPLIINDLAHDDNFKNRPFVRNHPSLRFYAATPISTKSGFNIGTLCVLDDHPRDGLSDVEKTFLVDMAVSIMTHLEMTRVKDEHRRSEKMVKGLGLFVEGGSALSEWIHDVAKSTAAKHQGLGDESQFEHSVKGRLQGNTDLDSVSITEERVSASDTTKPEGAGYIRPLGTRLPQFQVEDIQSQTQDEATAELHSVTATHNESEFNSTAPSSGGQDTLFSSTSVSSVAPTLAGAQNESPGIGSKAGLGSNHSSRTSSADLQETLLSENLKDVFLRASNMIRECIEIEGTMFLDASVGTFGGNTKLRPSPGESESMESESQDSTESSSKEEPLDPPIRDAQSSEVSSVSSYTSQLRKNISTERHDEKSKCCKVLGSSTEEKASLKGDEDLENYVPLSEAFLHRLLHKYPRGHVFNLSNIDSTTYTPSDTRDPARAESISYTKELRKAKRGTKRRAALRESAKQAEIDALLQMLPGAQSVVFFPLWDPHRERWFAGSFAWTNRSTRVLTRAEDLSYLAAFGNSIMAEVARLDTMAADQAKSDFISSISHELRSPLHGILASVEFLQGTSVDMFQNSMLDTIEQCGRTLLDTIQHVLDYAKINNFTNSKKHKRNGDKLSSHGHGQKSSSGVVGLSVDVDISALTEDVVESVYAGHEFQGNSSLGVTDEASGFPAEGLRRNSDNSIDTGPDQFGDHPAPKKDRLAVIVDIGWRSNWTFNTQSGALRRVLMNLFGNALKYTDVGWVKISLESEDIKPTSSQIQQSRITITVSDSGRGISPEFLHNHLFTAFSQENPLNPGTGLGMSIVMQIVHSLRGVVEVQSELGVGTEVKVSLTLSQATTPLADPLNTSDDNSIMSVREKTCGRTLGLVGFEVSSDMSVNESQLLTSLQASFKRAATQWFGMNITLLHSQEAPPSDIYIANEYAGLQPFLGGGPVIILCSNASLYRAYTRRMGDRSTQNNNMKLAHFVSKPCGPHKLAKAFAFCLGKALNQRPQMSPVGFVGEPLASPQSLSNMSPDLTHHLAKLRVGDGYFPVGAGPSHESSSEASKSSPPTAFANKPTRKKPVLLLVEDNKINLKLLETFMKKNNYEYDRAENGQLALEAFQNAGYRYDIVLMDISMPVMNGMDSAREMRKIERERGQKAAIIVALTGLASASARQEAYINGIDSFWTKPVSFHELHKFLNNWTPETKS